MMEELGVFPHNLATSSPVVIGDLIYLVTSNGVDEGHLFHPCSPRAPSFLAVNKHTGEVAWESDACPGATSFTGSGRAPPMARSTARASFTFPAATAGSTRSTRLTGDLEIWKFDLNPKDSVWELGGRGTRNNIIGTPVFHQNRVYLGVGQDPEHGIGPGHFYAIDATQTGDVTAIRRRLALSTISRARSPPPPSMRTSSLSPTSTAFVYCLNRNSGDLHWKYDTLAAIWGSPTVIDGKVYMGDEDGDMAVLEAVEAEMNVIAENTVN
jgi:outer membrane protein assembly factor BamB